MNFPPHDINSWHARIKSKLPQIPRQYIALSIDIQRLLFIRDNSILADYPVSTGKNGIGNQSGSGKTPLGLHRIIQKIGHASPLFAIFTDRIDTGAIWTPSQPGDFVLTRILRLEGCEGGINRGAGIDTFERYIYIHGSSHENLIGTPQSHGCITLRNTDIIQLFDQTCEGDFVIIN